MSSCTRGKSDHLSHLSDIHKNKKHQKTKQRASGLPGYYNAVAPPSPHETQGAAPGPPVPAAAAPAADRGRGDLGAEAAVAQRHHRTILPQVPASRLRRQPQVIPGGWRSSRKFNKTHTKILP